MMQIPMAFVIMIIWQLVTVIIERMLYLRRMHVCKILFQILMVVALHIYLFIALPWDTTRYRVRCYTRVISPNI